MTSLVRRMYDTGSLGSQLGWDPFELLRDMGPWYPFQALGFPGNSLAFSPDFSVSESDDAYTLQADLPGVDEKDLAVTLTGSTLTIRGERVEENRHEQHHYQTYARSYGRFTRNFSLPEIADLEHVEAALKNGVLTVRVAKRAEAKPRKIEIKGALGGFVEKVKGVLAKDNSKHRKHDDAPAQASG
jgi:HSP20 family protein